MKKCKDCFFNFIRQALFIFPALYCACGRKKREEKLREMKTVDAVGKEEDLCQSPTKKSQVLASLSRRMDSGGSHWEDKKAKVKIALISNTIA